MIIHITSLSLFVGYVCCCVFGACRVKQLGIDPDSRLYRLTTVYL